MNQKVVNLIAAQLGILIGLTSWLVYSRFPSTEPRSAAEIQEGTTHFATVTSALESRNQRPSTVDYRADRERAQPADEEPVLTLQQRYDREIAGPPYAGSGVENRSIAVNSPSYAQVAQEPTVIPAAYAESPQTVEYTQPVQNVVYVQPTQIVVYSNSRPFLNRCRPVLPSDEVRPITRQCPDRGNRDARTPSVQPPCPPTERFRPRGNVRQFAETGVQQRRVTLPVSPRAGRSSSSVP